jgi:hypothetical protein
MFSIGTPRPKVNGTEYPRAPANRLHTLHCKRTSPRGALLEAEDAEEAQLTARLEAYLKSPEGIARSRIRALESKLRRYRTDAEQSEIDALRALYPDPPRLRSV